MQGEQKNKYIQLRRSPARLLKRDFDMLLGFHLRDRTDQQISSRYEALTDLIRRLRPWWRTTHFL